MRLLSHLFTAGLLLLGLAVVGAVLVYDHYSNDLPDYSYLKDYQPPILSRIYADDGRMMATIAAEQRVFIPITAVPRRVIDAFLSAEDASFYEHGGVDFFGILRAAIENVHNVATNKRPQGASTITQQVAKNMLLSNEVSVARKMREAILATRIEKALSKDRILEIYLNEIFLGNRSYGIAAAALNYFNKSLDELSIAEAAYLAALPKAPNNYNPVRDHDAAVARRNWVIGRMAENDKITREEAEAAMREPLAMRTRDEAETANADYFSEEVRRQLVAQYGDEQVLKGGLEVKTSLDPRLQDFATRALRDGLIDFDRRERGWRGPVAHITDFADWQQKLQKMPMPPGGEGWLLAVVIAINPHEASIALADGSRNGRIPWSELKWARREYPGERFGPAIGKPGDVLSVGDIIMVEKVKTDSEGKDYPAATFTLRQVPTIQGAIVALDPHTGRVFAMTGGFSARISQFNRATQAWRQPGSAFKPFVYMAALDKGFTPSSLILDAPFEYDQGPGLPLWRPENYSQEFYGPTPLRVGIEKSRNVMTVRLANAIGMPAVVDYAKKFGVVDDMPSLLSFSLGAKETTPLKLTAAYGMIVNGGKRIVPSLIDRVEDRNGKTIWRADQRECTGCQTSAWSPDMQPPDIPDTRAQIEDPRIVYQMVSIMQGVVQRGTAVKLRDLGIPLAGKTGTTNESRDAWFIGFTPDLVCGVFVGFDDPHPLGSHETGASVAVPIFKKFMADAVKGKPAIPFRVPPGLRMVRISASTGALASVGDKDAIWEAYIPGTEPQDGQMRQVLDGSVTGSASEGAAAGMAIDPHQDDDNGDVVVIDGTAPQEQKYPPSTEPAALAPAFETVPDFKVEHPAASGTTPSTTGTGGLY
ncbi:MAG: penicillin-binding protein 1A [Bdellovibrionales bacterium]